MKKKVYLTEGQLVKIIEKSVKRILNEDDSNKIEVSTKMSDKATKGLLKLIKKSDIPSHFIGRFLMVLRTTVKGESQNKPLGGIAPEFRNVFYKASDFLSGFLYNDAVTAIENVENYYNSMFRNY